MSDDSKSNDHHITLTTWNLRSLPLHLEEAVALKSTVVAIQEADIPEYKVKEIRDNIKAMKLYVKLPYPSDLATEAGRRRGRRICTVTTTNFTESECSDDTTRFLQASGRWQEIVIPTSVKDKFVIVANFYGMSSASGSVPIYNSNERLIAAAVVRMLQFPHVPYFIMGDFNINPQCSRVISKMVSNGIVHDVLLDWQHGALPQPTFCRDGVHLGMSGSGVTRIDAVLSNHVGAHSVHKVQ